jgi:DNA helicase-2/ATP-dependent DNA helicase PcrA
LQDRIFRLIAGKNKNLFVVGDVKQSIYGFRGATVINFEKFTDRYPEAKTYFLNVNFRSTKNIVELSNKVFEDVVKRELESRRRHGEKIRLLYGENSDQTAKKTIDLIKQLRGENIIKNYGDIALLFRSLKNHAPEFIKYLNKEKIPYVTFGDGQFLEREEIKAIIYLMSYVTQELYIDNKFHEWKEWWKKDIFAGDFFDFSQETKRTIIEGEFNLYDLRDEEDFKKQRFNNKTDIAKLIKLNKLKYDVEREKDSFGDYQRGKNSLLIIFYKILDYSGYFKRLMEEPTNQNREKLHNLGRLSEIINRYMDISKREDIKGFLWYLYNSGENIDQTKIEDENTVKLMTVHQAKGLEFPVVFLCCLNEGRFPLRYRSGEFLHIPDEFLDKEETEEAKDEFFEEEKRLFYVGLTRAQDNLIFTASEKHRVKRWKISRFLEEIPDELMTDEDFKLSAEKQYRVKKEVPNLNYSAINTFIDCPLRYSLIYNYDFATPPSYMQRVGTFIHNSLQQIHEHIRKGENISPEDMKNIVDRYWINLPMSEKKNNEMKLKKVQELVTYYVYAKDNYKEILAIEESFSHIDDNMIVKGKVDLIAKDKEGKVCLIDFKARTQKGIKETNVDKQLQIYDYCLDTEYKIDNLIAYTTEDNKASYFPTDKKKTKDFLINVSTKMSKEDFHKQKNAFCSQCQFKFYCKEEGND